ncbi:MAG: hypothetical protein GY711_23145 [bacterium]|nr:hypothetical protein [bacterium]
MSVPWLALMLPLAACAGDAPPAALEPERAESHTLADTGSAPNLLAPDPARSVPVVATAPRPATWELEDPGLISGPYRKRSPLGSAAEEVASSTPNDIAQRRRIRQLEVDRKEYLAMPARQRTGHRREVYHLGLLELGQLLATRSRTATPTPKPAAKLYRDKAIDALEELGLDAGDDSDFGLRAYQLLADLHRAAGNEVDATAYEQEIQRVLEK